MLENETEILTICQLDGRACPFPEGDYWLGDIGRDNCPIQRYEDAHHVDESGRLVIDDMCAHARYAWVTD